MDMKRKSVYIFPPASDNAENPFIINLRNSLIENNFIVKGYGRHGIIGIIKYLFLVDTFILNWPENIIFGKYGLIKYYLFEMLMELFRVRGGKIIWFFHNIEPHRGHNRFTKAAYKYLFKNATSIICLSRAAKFYVERYSLTKEIYYFPHPFKNEGFNCKNSTQKIYDILMWGNIVPYKGIKQFLDYVISTNIKYKILIIGKCLDEELIPVLDKYSNDHIIIENRFVDFEELKDLIAESRYVLFTYKKGSVSSSGALMDSLQYGGTVIGPSVGAFFDMAENRVAFTYQNFQDIFKILEDKKTIDVKVLKNFVNSNTWSCFGKSLSDIIYKING